MADDMTRRELLGAAGVAGVTVLASGAAAAQEQGKGEQNPNVQGGPSRLQVVHDQQGNIVAMGYVDQPKPEAAGAERLTAQAVALGEYGQSVVVVELPREFARMELGMVAERLQFDAKARKLVPRNRP
jgi:hypothetical protein